MGDYPENLVPVFDAVHVSDRHIRDLDLFRQFRGKGDRPDDEFDLEQLLKALDVGCEHRLEAFRRLRTI